MRLTRRLALWIRILLEKLVVAQPVKEFLFTMFKIA
jgi:hypothetical protein